VKALTVQQPWAWAIVHGGKDVENRTQAWTYRGPLAIHAGSRFSDRGGRSPLLLQHEAYADADMVKGAIIGVVDLVDVHGAQSVGFWPEQPACCESPWAETAYEQHLDGRTRRDIVHLVLEHPRPLAEPIPCRGALGLWTPPVEVLDQLQAVTR
jgi:hypothetical protein